MARKALQIKDAIDGYIVRCKSKGFSHRTIEWYEQKLRFFCAYMLEQQSTKDLKSVTLMHLRAFVLHVHAMKSRTNNNVSEITVKGYVQVIKGFFSWCVSEDLLKTDPATKLERPKVGEYVITTFSEDQIKALFSTCDLRTERGYRDYAIMMLLLGTGVWVSELCGLRLQDVHKDYVRVLGKGRKEREVGVHSDTVKCVWKYVHKFGDASDEGEQLLFINRSGDPLTRSGVARLIADAGDKAGLYDVRVSPHTFRHTFAIMYLKNGGDVYKLSRLLGHSDIKTTEEYLKSFQSREARRDHNHLSPVNRVRVVKKERARRSDNLFD